MNGTILVADDSVVVRTVLARELVTAGWEVRQAADGEQAVESCREHPPDIVLLDIEMPRLNGFQALAALQRDPELAQIPVIFLTGRDSGADVAEGLRRGAHDYLRKPFETAELTARLTVARRMKSLQDELRARNRELERLATTDLLTGLDNRRSAQEKLDEHVTRARHLGGDLSVLLIDVDHFKRVNDEHGHASGDAVLRELSQRLRARLRPQDTCGRWGGEELLVVLPDTDRDDAGSIAEHLRAAVADAPYVDATIPVTASIGVADWDHDTESELVKRADSALYAAKAAGRNCVRAAIPAMPATLSVSSSR